MKREFSMVLAGVSVICSWPLAAQTREDRSADAQLAARMAEACGSAPGSQQPLAERTTYMTCLMRELASEWASRVPRVVDEATTLTDVTAGGTTLTFQFTIAADSASIPAEANESALRTVRANACRDPQMVATMNSGGSYRYVFLDRNGELLGETTLDRC